MQQQERGCPGCHRRRCLHRQRRQRADRPDAACVAGPRRGSAGPQSGLSTLDGRVTLNQGRAVHYPCPPERGFSPNPEAIASTDHAAHARYRGDQSEQSDRRRVPRKPARGDRADRRETPAGSVQRRDLRPDDLRRRASSSRWRRWSTTRCARTFSGLSKVYRACGYRVGWVSFSAAMSSTRANTCRRSTCCRRCACAATCPANGPCRPRSAATRASTSSVRPGGRLYESRQGDHRGRRPQPVPVSHSTDGRAVRVRGRADGESFPTSTTRQFALDLLEHKHVLVAPGSSFNVPYRNHFRVTNLPEPQMLADVFGRMEELLQSYAVGELPATRPNPALRVVDATAKR